MGWRGCTAQLLIRLFFLCIYGNKLLFINTTLPLKNGRKSCNPATPPQQNPRAFHPYAHVRRFFKRNSSLHPPPAPPASGCCFAYMRDITRAKKMNKEIPEKVDGGDEIALVYSSSVQADG